MDRSVLILIIVGIIASFGLGMAIGIETEKKEVIKRAQEYNKDCYTNENLEYIIFGESQL